MLSNDLFDGLTILKSLMQLLDNFATLVKPRESFPEFLLRNCLRSSLDIHIYIYVRRFPNVKYDIWALNEAFCSFLFNPSPHTHKYSRKHHMKCGWVCSDVADSVELLPFYARIESRKDKISLQSFLD